MDGSGADLVPFEVRLQQERLGAVTIFTEQIWTDATWGSRKSRREKNKEIRPGTRKIWPCPTTHKERRPEGEQPESGERWHGEQTDRWSVREGGARGRRWREESFLGRREKRGFNSHSLELYEILMADSSSSTTESSSPVFSSVTLRLSLCISIDRILITREYGQSLWSPRVSSLYRIGAGKVDSDWFFFNHKSRIFVMDAQGSVLMSKDSVTEVSKIADPFSILFALGISIIENHISPSVFFLFTQLSWLLYF